MLDINENRNNLALEVLRLPGDPEYIELKRIAIDILSKALKEQA